MSWIQDALGIGDSDGTFGTGSYRGDYTDGEMASDLGGVRQATAAQVDPTAQAQGRGYQQDLMSLLQGQASGVAPSAAQTQLNQATDRNAAQALGLASSQRGVNPGLALRMGLQAGANANQAAAGQSALARLAEQQGAEGLLGQVAGQSRGQDLDLAGQNAQLTQQAGMFNAGQYDQQLLAALEARRQLRAQRNAQIAQLEAQRRQGAQQLGQKGIGAILSGGSAGAGNAALGGAQNGALAMLPGGV